jgi:NAD(P)-dependent dehydrogenase (short-subunit alcohol dehydrogenase family)
MKKTLLITGSTDGIGKELVRMGLERDFSITAHGRNKERLDKMKDEMLQDFPDSEIRFIQADFSDLEQTAEAFKDYKKQYGMPDVLINNAGVLNTEKHITKNGFEESFQINHLAPFLITQILIKDCKFEKEYRIINVSSMIHAFEIDFDNLNAEKYFSSQSVYGLTKLCNILFTNKLQRKYSDTKLLAASVHPGVINTKLLRQQWGGGAPPAEGAANVFYALEFEGLQAIPGAYIENRRPMQAADIAYEESVQDRLWNISEKFLEPYIA